MSDFSSGTYRRLASAMQAALQIPEGDTLVFLIGQGTESSNLAALETWVRETLPQLEEECSRAALPHLLSRLERTLGKWGAA